MLTLGIESSCDETACAIVRDGKEILSNVVSSQVDLHQAFGGVIPELACRRHIDAMLPVVEEALEQAGVRHEDIDLIAAAEKPGLIGALLLGIMTGKALALSWDKPYVGVDHVEAHLYAPFMTEGVEVSFPCIGAVLSGGHTCLYLMRAVDDYTLIGETSDDAVGEAFDKVAKVLSLPYPGGPEVEKLARFGNPEAYPFKMGQVKGEPYGFSLSGIKTAVLYAVKGQDGKTPKDLSEQERADIAASFQRKAFDDIIHKVMNAANEYGCSTVALGGGVTQSQTLRELFAKLAPELTLLWPEPGLSLDNGAMIAGLAANRCKERHIAWVS